MKTSFVYKTTIDLRRQQHEIFWDTIANVGDQEAHTFMLDFLDEDGNQLDLTGAGVVLYAIRPDNKTVYMEGTVEGKYAVASLDDTCYAYEGKLRCTLVVSKGNVALSAVRVNINIGIANTDAIVDPGETIPSLAELLAQIAVMEAATEAANQATSNANAKADLANAAASTANTAASNANAKATLADNAKDRANTAASAIEGMTVSATGRDAGTSPTVAISDVSGHKNIHFGIPKGDKGEKGDTGDPAEIDEMTVYYQNSINGTTIPTGAWSTTQPVTPQGQFLWIKTHKAWNNGQETDEYSVSRMGIDGRGRVETVMDISPDSSGNISLAAAVTVVDDILTLTFS